MGLRRLLAVPALLCGLALAGCSLNGATTASPLSPRGTTLAFESIDGLPRGQFQTFVRALTEEADARQISVVTRESAASYRARGYVAAHLRGRQTVIAWVWDVYDTDTQRALRIAGEERGKGGQRGWSAADDAMLKRIARDSVAQLAGFLAAPSHPPAAPAPAPAPSEGVAVAAAPASPGRSVAPDIGWRRPSASAAGASVAAYNGAESR